MFFRILIILVLSSCSLQATEQKRKILLSTLDPKSASQHLAFYQLYSDTFEGQEALKRAWGLLSKQSSMPTPLHQLPSPHALESIIALINREPSEPLPKMSARDLSAIDSLSSHFANRRLKGYKAASEENVLALDSNEIDLARGLLLSQSIPLPDIEIYEAMIDLMALQIQSQINQNDPPEKIVQIMNQFVFDELKFRFPPHSAYAKDIDLYTFLPSVLDSRRGVCLGVSILYICLAQRLDIPLEIITPPGHIYVRFRKGEHVINIETTARGIDIESEQYLGLNTRRLQERTIKETIGFAHVNQASLYWNTDDQEKTVPTYETALKYIQNDPAIYELYGYALVVNGEREKGTRLLRKYGNVLPDHAVALDPLCEDFLEGKTDEQGILNCLLHVDEDRESLTSKRDKILEHLERYPKFRSGLFSLATTLMQMHREGEALKILKKYHDLDANNPTVEYILAILSAKRFDLNQSWVHLKNAEKLVAARDHKPKALKELRKQLSILYPE